MTLLGVVLHSGVTYTVADLGSAWSLKDPDTRNVAFDLLGGFIHSFRMPVFFVVAGFFGALLFTNGSGTLRIFLASHPIACWVCAARIEGRGRRRSALEAPSPQVHRVRHVESSVVVGVAGVVAVFIGSSIEKKIDEPYSVRNVQSTILITITSHEDVPGRGRPGETREIASRASRTI